MINEKLRNAWFDLLCGPGPELKRGLLLGLPVFAILLLILGANWAVIVGLVALAALLVFSIILALRTIGKINEAQALTALTYNLQESGFHLQDLFLDNAAATPMLLLFLFKCLRICQPKTILELGSGQTTKLLNQFAKVQPHCAVTSIEHDAFWLETLKRYVDDLKNHTLVHAPLRAVTVENSLSVQWYELSEKFSANKYELILVDGPSGEARYSRAGVLSVLPRVLAENFVLIFDDTNRPGEKMTVDLVRRTLSQAQIAYQCFYLNGTKQQTIFCSPSLSFLRYV